MSVGESESEARAALEGFPTTWKRIVTDPHGFVAAMPEAGGLQEPVTFLVLCAVANALGHLLLGFGLSGMLLVLVGQLLAAVVLAAVLVLIAQNLFDGRAGFEPTFRAVAYAWAPLVVAWVPLVGAVALLYGAYVLLRGVERVQRLDITRAVMTVAIGFAVLLVLQWSV